MTVRHGPLRFTCYGSVSKTFGVSFQEVTYIYILGPWLKTKLKSHVILYWVKWFVIAEDGDQFERMNVKVLNNNTQKHFPN